MSLQSLGFNSWFERQLAEIDKPDYRLARVTAVNRDNYLIRNESVEILSEITGKLMYSAESGTDLPAVGDWAFVQYYNDDTFAIIDEVLPRRSVLKRKTAGKKIEYQLIAANVDVAFIMQSCDANFNLGRMERYLVMANEGNINPVVLLSKSDLVSEERLQEMIDAVRRSKIECPIVPFSNETGSGLETIREMLEPGKTYCMLGSSGVGKSTLINHLLGKELFETSVVREKDGKGRHTTTRRQLIILENGAMVIDTPGMRELGNIGVDSGIGDVFDDILSLAQSCRFNDCSHTNEAGCAVLRAIEDGELDERRYQSYLKLLRESAHHQRSYLEKRNRDKAFGKMVKSITKHHKKR